MPKNRCAKKCVDWGSVERRLEESSSRQWVEGSLVEFCPFCGSGDVQRASGSYSCWGCGARFKVKVID